MFFGNVFSILFLFQENNNKIAKMTEQWIGKAVSIYCRGELGIFQGTIKSANSKTLTVVRAFRNGVPLQQQDMEVTFKYVRFK